MVLRATFFSLPRQKNNTDQEKKQRSKEAEERKEVKRGAFEKHKCTTLHCIYGNNP